VSINARRQSTPATVRMQVMARATNNEDFAISTTIAADRLNIPVKIRAVEALAARQIGTPRPVGGSTFPTSCGVRNKMMRNRPSNSNVIPKERMARAAAIGLSLSCCTMRAIIATIWVKIHVF
jgi:hypothetical protein